MTAARGGTLTEFLLARITEDAWVAEAADMTRHFGDPGELARKVQDVCAVEEIAHTVRHNPARVLAECEAKRRIVEHLASGPVYVGTFGSAVPSTSDFVPGTPGTSESASYVLALLALPYADHPDYRDEWKPESLS